jgi:DNA-directed RNA polymerase
VKCDFRGRIYGASHFNFQRQDHIRGLFQFNRGQTITSELEQRLLMDNAAALSGYKGIGLDREIWVHSNWELIEKTALGQTDAWLEMEDRFQFLAACIELHAARKHGLGFVTHLPISIDATCSGLQHICAMTRDDKVARFVNLISTVREPDKQFVGAIGVSIFGPGDIYQAVADIVSGQVAALPEGDPLRDIRNRIDRDLVKRPVMSYSYSVTPYGAAKQIEEVLDDDDDALKNLEDETADALGQANIRLQNKQCRRLAKLIEEAVGELLQEGEKFRDYLQKLARAVADKGQILKWRTPSGFPFANRYHVPNIKRVRLLLNDIDIRRTFADGHEPTIKKRKAANAIAPNIIHALDASHLARTVNACVSTGIRDIVTVHDSFGCLIPQAREMNRIVRDEFVQMYEEHDPLEEIRRAALRVLGDSQSLEPVPNRGPFNIRETSGALWAFRR